MPLRTFIALASFCLLMLSKQVLSAAGPISMSEPETVGISSQRLGLLDKVLREHVEEGKVAGLVAGVVRHGKLVYLEAMGWQNIELAQPMRTDSIFQIRSMSKPITAVAVLQLVDEGKLALSDPVSRYIPSFKTLTVYVDPEQPESSATRKPNREPTIEDLLLNTGGLSHRFSALYRNNAVRSRADSLAVLSDKVAAIPLIGDPGEQWVYSISITVLGRVVEVVSGQPFDEYLRKEVFDPLEMPDTGFYVPPLKQDRLARAYRIPDGSSGLAPLQVMDVPITENPPLKEGAAGIVSTVPEYLRFLQALLNDGELDGHRVLEPKTVLAMTTNQIAQELMPFGTNPANPMFDRGWGYGLAVVTDASKSEYGVNNGEFGWSGSLGTFSWADPVTETAAVIMLQVQPAGAFSIASKFKALVYQSLID
ncbi:MAG: CubicO group peptidase (beta-lactamase class C family) [Pseudohongiellaceae bacterium]|jgi:CubicO group peptidase (beta-lactamase class C family)